MSKIEAVVPMNIDHALRQLTVLCPLFPKPLEGAKPDEIEALEALEADGDSEVDEEQPV